jgi:hypothetical protein
MAGYSGTPLWKKLGYKADLLACVEDEPAGYIKILELPHEVPVKWVKRTAPLIDFAHLFTSSKSGLGAKLKFFRKAIAPDGVIWVSWPKKASGVATDIAEDSQRDAALPIGLVDIKVCAVNEVWSGLKLVVRKELR